MVSRTKPTTVITATTVTTTTTVPTATTVIYLITGSYYARGTPTPGSWPGVGGGNYSDVGVGEKCFDCVKEKIFVYNLLHKDDITLQNYMPLKKLFNK